MTQKGTNRTPKRRTASDWAPRFLAALADTANIKAACEAAGKGATRSNVYRRRDEDEAFAAAMRDALDDAIDDLALEARRRARDGVPRVKFHQGAPIMIHARDAEGRPLLDDNGEPVLTPYVEYEHSDTLTMFLLKAHRPETYRETFGHEITGKDGGPIETVVRRYVGIDPEEV